MSQLDAFAPTWQFREVHRLFVAAPGTRVYAATKAVTAREVRFFRTLTWLRRLGRPGPPDILNPPPDRPILEVATRTGFLLLEDTAGEIVIGKVVIARPGAVGPQTAEDYRPGSALIRRMWLRAIRPAGDVALASPPGATRVLLPMRFGRFPLRLSPHADPGS